MITAGLLTLQTAAFASEADLKIPDLHEGHFAMFGGLSGYQILLYGASGVPTLIGRLYRGYTISPAGSLIGLVWAFFDGLGCGLIFAWLYNKLTPVTETK